MQTAELKSRRWEYLRVQVESHKIKNSDETVSELGRQGWELVSVVEAGNSWIHFWFKRARI